MISENTTVITSKYKKKNIFDKLGKTQQIKSNIKHQFSQYICRYVISQVVRVGL